MNCCLLLLLVFLFPLAAVAAPPTDEQIKTAVAAYRKDLKEHKRKDPRVAALLKDVSIAEMSVPQFELLGPMLDLAPLDTRKQFRDRLTLLSKQKDADGAVATALLPRLIELPEDNPGAPETFNEDRVASLIAAGDHPGFPAAIKAGRGTTVYYFMFFYAAHEDMVKNGLAKRLAALVDDTWPSTEIFDLAAFTEAVVAPEAGLDRAEIDRLREITTRLAQKCITDPATPEDQRDALLEVVTNLNSAAARGQLVGAPAPKLDFLWANTEKPLKSLDDLKGKVILLDFWATWCGPCIGAFPHLRELQEKYKDAPVAIVGVTSLQGWILDAKATDPAKRRIQGLKQDEEIAHLAPWVKKMDMTWTVVVTKQDVFNREYAVRGLPTVVIIDPKGVVRHAGLSPTDPKLSEMIDELLPK